jgi:hypothetical protein
MKIEFFAIVGALLIAVGFAVSAGAGSIADVDTDLIPDVFDNCSLTPNGPNDLKNQIDTDVDGFGDTCDCDFLQDGFVLGDDISDLFANFNGTSTLHDNTGDGFVLGDDVSNCFSRFNGTVGD